MAEILYNTVAKKAGQFPPDPLPTSILFVGTDDGLKREALDRIKAVALDESFADFDQETIDLSLGSASEDASDPVTRISEACGAVPYASPRRVVNVVSVQKLVKEKQDALAALLPRLPSLTLLLLVADAPEMEAGKPKGKQVELALRKAAVRSGMLLVCDAPEGADLRGRAAQMLAASGKSYEPAVLDLLLAASSLQGQNSADINALKHETSKLLSYCGEKDRITRVDASAILPVGTDENIFRLLDCIGARDVPKALHELDSLILAEGKPDATAARLIVMLQRHFRFLMLAKFLGDNRLLGKGALPQEVKDLLPGDMAGFVATQSYRLGSYAKQAANFHWDELRANVGRILSADLSMKGIIPGEQTMAAGPDFSGDPVATLRMVIFDLCRHTK